MTTTQARYSDYKETIFDHVPLYQTRLVKTKNPGFEVREQITNPTDVYDFLGEYFEDKDREHMVALFLDTANTVIGMTVMSVGSLSGAYCEPRAVFGPAMLTNAAAVILAHNHPSGNPEFSRDDINVTKKMRKAGKVMSIPVHDHLLFVEDRHVSMANRGIVF
jgi:DNA repair protein RadC